MEEYKKGMIHHYEHIKELLKSKYFDKKDKKANINLGISRIGATIDDSHLFAAKTSKLGNTFASMGAGIIMPPRDGLEMNMEAILEIVSQKLSEKKYDEGLQEYLSLLIDKSERDIFEVIVESGIDGYILTEVLIGRREFERDEIIRIGLTLGVTKIELLHLLARGKYTLRPNSNKEDFIILYCIENNLDVDTLENILKEVEKYEKELLK